MSKIVGEVKDTFLGGAEKKAGKQAVRELAKGREAASRLSEASRGTLFDLFGTAQESRRGGLEGALNVFQSSIPLQAQVAQGGNVAAQQALLAGLPEIQAAILGNRAPNMAALQPTTLPFDLSFINRGLPESAPITRPEPPQTADTPNTGVK